MTVLSKPNVTLHIEKLPRCNDKNNKNIDNLSIQLRNPMTIEKFEGINKGNSRIIFLILLIMISLIYVYY